MSDITSGPARSWEDVYRAQTARIQELETEIAELREKNEQQAAEITALREVILWLDRQRDPDGVFKPVGMTEAALGALLRAHGERP